MTDSSPKTRFILLPVVALYDIFHHMDVTEQFHLSKTSTKTRNLVKIFTRTRPYKQIYDLENDSYHLRKLADPFALNPLSFNGDDSKISKILENLIYISDVFNKPIAEFIIYESSTVIQILEKVQKLELRLENLTVKSSRTIPAKNYKFLVNLGTRCTRNFQISERISPNGFEFSDCPEFKCYSILIGSAEWITVDLLKRCFIGCQNVELHYSRMDFCDLNSFIVEWRLNSKMDTVTIRGDGEEQKVTVQAVLKDVPWKEVRHVKVRHQKFSIGYIISNNAEDKEVVVCWNKREFILTTKFEIQAPEGNL